jgi:hypothetical protein
MNWQKQAGPPAPAGWLSSLARGAKDIAGYSLGGYGRSMRNAQQTLDSSRKALGAANTDLAGRTSKHDSHSAWPPVEETRARLMELQRSKADPRLINQARRDLENMSRQTTARIDAGEAVVRARQEVARLTQEEAAHQQAVGQAEQTYARGKQLTGTAAKNVAKGTAVLGGGTAVLGAGGVLSEREPRPGKKDLLPMGPEKPAETLATTPGGSFEDSARAALGSLAGGGAATAKHDLPAPSVAPQVLGTHTPATDARAAGEPYGPQPAGLAERALGFARANPLTAGAMLGLPLAAGGALGGYLASGPSRKKKRRDDE